MRKTLLPFVALVVTWPQPAVQNCLKEGLWTVAKHRPSWATAEHSNKRPKLNCETSDCHLSPWRLHSPPSLSLSWLSAGRLRLCKLKWVWRLVFLYEWCCQDEMPSWHAWAICCCLIHRPCCLACIAGEQSSINALFTLVDYKPHETCANLFHVFLKLTLFVVYSRQRTGPLFTFFDSNFCCLSSRRMDCPSHLKPSRGFTSWRRATAWLDNRVHDSGQAPCPSVLTPCSHRSSCPSVGRGEHLHRSPD